MNYEFGGRFRLILKGAGLRTLKIILMTIIWIF